MEARCSGYTKVSYIELYKGPWTGILFFLMSTFGAFTMVLWFYGCSRNWSTKGFAYSFADIFEQVKWKIYLKFHL